MPIHDWTRVSAGIFHDFHTSWIPTIKRALNSGLLPPDYYALAEQIAGGWGPDVLTLKRPAQPPEGGQRRDGIGGGGVAVAEQPPKAQFHTRSDTGQYATKARAVVIRHSSTHDVVAIVEIVSPGNKDSRRSVQEFLRKAEDMLLAGVHLLAIDLFPPGTSDPQGMAKLLLEHLDGENEFDWPADRPLSLGAFVAGPSHESYLEPAAVGSPLPSMPLFLTPDTYVPVPLEATYMTAFNDVPEVWRDVVAGRSGN